MKRSLAFHAYSIFVWGILWAALMLLGILPELTFSNMFRWKVVTSFVVGVVVNFMIMKYLEGLLGLSDTSKPYLHVIVDYVGFFACFAVLLRAFGV